MRRDHGVVVHHLVRVHAVVAQQGQIVVGIVRGSLEALGGEKWPNGGHDFRQGQLLPGQVANRHVPGQSPIDGETESRQLSRHGVGAAGLGVKGEGTGLPDGGDHRVQLVRGVDDPIIAIRRFLGIRKRRSRRPGGVFRRCCPGSVGRGNASHYAVELQRGHQGDHLGSLVVTELAGIEIQVGRGIAFDGGQEAIFKGLVPVRRQAVLHPFLGYLLQMLVDALQGAVVAQQRGGRLVPDAGHPGDIVGFVADQGFVVRLLFGGQPAVSRR